MRYACLVFQSIGGPKVYDVLLVWQRERSIIDVGSPQPSSIGVIMARAVLLSRDTAATLFGCLLAGNPLSGSRLPLTSPSSAIPFFPSVLQVHA